MGLAAQQHTQPGYKQTDLGLLPEEWDVRRIDALLDDRTILGHLDGNHGELYPRSSEFKEHGVPYIGANDFEEGFVTFTRCKYLSTDRARQFRKGMAKNGDVLFAHNATVGPVALLRTDYEFVILSTTATYFRCNEHKLNAVYLKYALQSPSFARQYKAVMAQSTRFQVPITAQRKFSLVIPPVPEQRAIAVALSDVDDLVGTLNELIAKKFDLKQAVMQQILTGKQRLPGFLGEWEVKHLGDVIEEIGDGGTPSTMNPRNFGGPVHWVVIEDIKDEIFTTKNTLTERGLKSCAAKLWKPGTLILSTGATIGEVGIARIPVATKQGICGLVINQSKANTDFLKYWFVQNKPLILSKAQGSSIKEVRAPTLVRFEIQLPKVDEQTAIAAVLSDMDAEIAALEERRDNTRAIKQGMMQELLTGKTRLT